MGAQRAAAAALVVAAAAVGAPASTVCGALHELEEGAPVSNVEGERAMAEGAGKTDANLRRAQELLTELRGVSMAQPQVGPLGRAIANAVDFLLSRYIEER